MSSTQPSKSLIAIWISLISNIVLTLLKTGVGLAFGSSVLIADGIHNAGDIIATVAALTSSMVSKKPADDDHPYGHGKAEVVASAFVAVILALAAIWIGYHSLLTLMEPAVSESSLPLIAAVISLLWKLALYVYTVRIGRLEKSKSVLATAYDHLADVYASLAAVLGIGLALAGEHLGWSWTAYGDPIAGIIVSLLVLKLAVEMGKESIDILMERTISPERLARYEKAVFALEPIKRMDRIRAREHGHYIIVDIRVGIPSHYTIQQGHDISREIKRCIMECDEDVIEVMVHLNPWNEGE